MARRCAILSLSLACLALPGRARGQPSDPARAAYEEGVSALVAGRSQEAAAALERSLELRPLPVVRYNLGLAYRALGRYLRAIELFDAWLAAPEPDATALRLTSVRAEREDLFRALVTLELQVEPAGATVSLDGTPLGSRSLSLDPGEHVLEATAVGHRPLRRVIHPPPGARWQEALVLVPLRLGHLRVEPSVLTAQVRVDGEPVGRGRYEGDLEAGEHVVELTAEGYQPFTRRVRVRAGDSLRMDAALGRTAPRWVLPVAVVSGAALVAGVVVAALLLNDPGPERVPGRWLNVDE